MLQFSLLLYKCYKNKVILPILNIKTRTIFNFIFIFCLVELIIEMIFVDYFTC